MLAVKVLDLMVYTPVVESAVPVPIKVLPWYKFTTAPGVALPLNVGVATLVMLSAKPLSLAIEVMASATKAAALGAVGPTVSIAMVRVVLEVVPFKTCVAVINRFWLSPAKVLR